MIYLHFPFCRSFCIYCDFYSELCTERFEGYKAALFREIGAREDEILKNRSLHAPDTLYIGGGTPSLAPLSFFEEISGRLGGGFEEFTVEVNPDDVIYDFAVGLRAAGVNRISMGVQSFCDEHLRWMSRRHSSEGAQKAFHILREAGFRNISIDLIFGYDPYPIGIDPDCDLLMRRWQEDVEMAVELSPEHISAYQMTVEEGSVLGRRSALGEYVEPDDELSAAQYSFLCRRLAAAGYEHYEISNFAKEGSLSRHNSAYWSYVPYVGLGPAAHSFTGIDPEASSSSPRRRWNPDDLDRYINNPEEFREEVLSREDMRIERIMLGLRCFKGLPLAQAGEMDMNVVERLISQGLLRRDGDTLHIPEDKWLVSDSVIRDLI